MNDNLGLVLVVDDEKDLRHLVDFNLRQAGYRTLLAATGREALEKALSHAPQLVVLDLNLPDISGTEVCRRLKSDAKTQHTAVIMLTARSTELDRIVGLELGADDYVTKPFSVRELVLRVDAIRRRLAKSGAKPSGTERLLRAGNIELDLESYIARVDGEETALTLLEFRLLAYLIEGHGRVRSRDDLLANVWNASTETETRTIDTHVKRLRDKLDPSGKLIETVRGVGYRIRQPND